MEFVPMELVTKVVEKLWDQLSHEYETFKGFEDDVAELKSNLDLLKSFLKDADVKRHTNEMVRHCVEEIKEIVYDAEDVIDMCILKENKSGIMKRIIRFACTIVDRRKIVYDIKGISKRISKVIQDMQSFGVKQMIIDAHPLQERQKEMRQQFAKSNESNLVCLEENVYKLVGYLTEEEEIQIISVTGMGGLGKTTLARQVFENADVRHKFKRFAWVCVSQEFTRISVWQTILQNLTSKERKDEIQKMNEVELQDELYQLFQTSKSLIVLDDIWRKEDWNRIKGIFPPTKGWKVLLTSRNEWSGMREDTKYTNLKPECLTFKDSWTLFERIVPRKDASEFNFDKEMEELGEQMVKHCGGLPLAIKVLGGLLAEKYTLHDWKRLAENIGSELMGGDDNSCNYILSLSYEELSGYLKHCFLYLAHFPEDYEIEVGRLSYYWAAEGISDPRRNDGETIRDIGDRYIEELVRRNMVIADRDEATLRYERCHMHDMMREVCLLKAKEENFLDFISSHPPTTNIQSSIRSRRCVSRYPKKLHVKREVNNPKLRSLVLLQGKSYCKVSSSSYTELELLRVLDLSKTIFRRRRLASGIGKLVHLRYLSLEDAIISHLPCSLGNLKLLIYLNLCVYGTVYVPNVLMGMLELRFLALPQRMHKKTRLELSNQVKLETLKYFSTKNSSLEDIRGMVKLKVLIIELTQETSMETIYASIGGLRNLESLDIWFKRRIEDEIVFDFPHLKTLMMREIPRLPKEQNFPSCVTTVNLCSCRLEEDPMPILENLVLLKGLCLYFNSLIGKRMVCLGSGFPKLLKLEIYELYKWEEWIIEEGSMPLLQSLSLKDCPELKEFPDGLRFITSIKELDTDQQWKERLSEGGQEYYKVKHIPRVNFSKGLKLQSEIRRNVMYI